jgi:hypothetical protein
VGRLLAQDARDLRQFGQQARDVEAGLGLHPKEVGRDPEGERQTVQRPCKLLAGPLMLRDDARGARGDKLQGVLLRQEPEL